MRSKSNHVSHQAIYHPATCVNSVSFQIDRIYGICYGPALPVFGCRQLTVGHSVSG